MKCNKCYNDFVPMFRRQRMCCDCRVPGYDYRRWVKHLWDKYAVKKYEFVRRIYG